MKLKAKAFLITLVAMTFQVGCGRFFGDLVGDAIWLRGID